MIGGSNVDAGNVSPYNSEDVTWWEADKIGYNDGELRILATSVYDDHRILKSDVRGMALDIDEMVTELKHGTLEEFDSNMDDVQRAIEHLLAEVS